MGMRLFFGVWLLYVGMVKWILFGPENFVGFITAAFNATWSPPILNSALAWIIIIAEPLAALWILSGKKPRTAWMSTAMLMFLLLFGQTILQKETVTDNWHYVIIALVCAALSDPENS